jgi:4-deoxy-L-threo-5-hexosulose-uronate ketol-isomerase
VIPIKFGSDPASVRGATTEQLRDRYLVDSLFHPGQLNLAYVSEDRTVLGGAIPFAEPLTLLPGGPVNTEYFLFNREVAVLHVGGGAGKVSVDGESHELTSKDCLYAGRGHASVQMTSVDATNPARLYLVSTIAHRECPTKKIAMAQVAATVLGAAETGNRRSIRRYVNPDQVESCSLLLGVTTLDAGSSWNTMPPHRHDRRSEIYFYFDIPADGRVFHFMGEPAETRHLIVANEQAVLSPSWSIHCGSGTAPYSFCWSMSGENLLYNDMDPVAIEELR